MAKLQLRITDELDARLRKEAARAGWTVSAYARYVLETSLGDDARMSVLNQIVWALNSKLQRRISAVGAAMRTELERILLEPDDGD